MKKLKVTVHMKSGKTLKYTAEQFDVIFSGGKVTSVKWLMTTPRLGYIDPEQIEAVEYRS